MGSSRPTPVRKRASRNGVALAVPTALALVVGAIGCASFQAQRPPHVSVAEVVSMSQAGVAPDVIIDRIEASGTVYRLTASQLADLRAQGVSDQVLDYMEETHLEAVRRNQQLQDESYWVFDDGYWYGGHPFGWDDDWYPARPFGRWHRR